MTPLHHLAWPEEQAPDALEALARASRMERAADTPPVPPGAPLAARLDARAAACGIELERTYTTWAEVPRFVAHGGPALVPLADHGMLALLGSRGRHALLLAPTLQVHAVPTEALHAVLRAGDLAAAEREADALLEAADVDVRRRARARTTLLEQGSGARWAAECIRLRIAPGRPFGDHVRAAGLHRQLATLLGLQLEQQVLLLLAWWTVGRGALEGTLDWSWLLGWALLLLTLVPLKAASTWLQGTLTLGLGTLLRQRLLVGATRLHPDTLRREAVGQLMGRVLEAESLELLVLAGGFTSLLAVLETVVAAAVLSLGAGAPLLLPLFLAWNGLVALGTWRLHRRRDAWTDARLHLTDDLVERMVGHRTRLVQERRERWHTGEDRLLSAYQERSEDLDALAARLPTLLAGGWLPVAFLGLLPAFLSGDPSAGGLATALGGILLGASALASLTGGLSALVGAHIAWRRVSLVFQAADGPGARAPLEPPETPSAPPDTAGMGPVGHLELADVAYRYPGRAHPILARCSARLDVGDRVLLTGPSGSGKSTLAAVLLGLRRPDAGLVLLDGLDRATWGEEGWRRRVASAPQFHENHVFTGTFAFNVLLGRRWPPTPDDLREMEAICEELGLGDLLARMPAGIQQVLGETGWQLSHGEQSRLFIARALLQGAEVTLLDESFAALDPANLARALACVDARARTLVVIAHP